MHIYIIYIYISIFMLVAAPLFSSRGENMSSLKRLSPLAESRETEGSVATTGRHDVVPQTIAAPRGTPGEPRRNASGRT